MSAEINTAPLMMLSLMVSTLLAIRVSDFTLVPVVLRYRPRRSLATTLPISTIMTGAEYSTSSGVMSFSILSAKIWMPTIIMIAAISKAPICSIFSWSLLNFLLAPSFSLITTMIPESVSIRPWMASDITASEPEMAPTAILKTARNRLTVIAR